MHRLVMALIVAAMTACSAGAQTPGAGVQVSGKTLFVIHTGFGGFTAEERAKAAENHILKAAVDPAVEARAIELVEIDGSTEIRMGGTVLLAVTDADSRAAGRPRQELAKEYAAAVESAIRSLRGGHSGRSLAIGLALSTLATCALIALLWGLRLLWFRALVIVAGWRGTRIRSLKIQRLQLLSADHLTSLLTGAAKGAIAAATLILIYFYVTLVLSFFPLTKGIAITLWDYVVDALASVLTGFVTQLPNAIFIAVIAVVTYYLLKLVHIIFRATERGIVKLPGFYREWSQPTYKIVRFLILAFAITIAFPYIPGSSSPAFRGISIFLGVLISLGSSGAVGNIVAGVFLTYTRAFQIGDYVRIGGAEGDIVERTLLVTRIRTIKNEEITIPNSIVLASHITNFGRSGQHRAVAVYTSVTIGYDAPWRTVHHLLLTAAGETKDVLSDPSPFVLQNSLGDFYVTYELNAYTNAPNRRPYILAELNSNIQDKFNEAGVQIMSPHYTSLRDGNTIAIPPEYRPRDYTAPGFRVVQASSATGGQS